MVPDRWVKPLWLDHWLQSLSAIGTGIFAEDRAFILQETFPQEPFVIFDEIHKYSNWRNYVKGLYDKHGDKKQILVTGSARLDLLLAFWRFFGGALSPLSLAPIECKRA